MRTQIEKAFIRVFLYSTKDFPDFAEEIDSLSTFPCTEFIMRISRNTQTNFRPQSNRVIVIRNEATSVFSRELMKQEEKILDIDKLELEELKDVLQDVGDIFEEHPTIMNYRAFREAIGKFARKAMSVAYRLEKKQGKRLSWTHEIVTIIDRAADELLHLVMQGQQNRLDIACKLASIKGMIVQIIV